MKHLMKPSFFAPPAAPTAKQMHALLCRFAR